MKVFLSVLALASTSSALVNSSSAHSHLLEEFENYMVKFGKRYPEAEELESFVSENPGFEPGYTHFFDLTEDEERAYFQSSSVNAEVEQLSLDSAAASERFVPSTPMFQPFNPAVHTQYPASVLHRNCQTSVRDQGSCGSCWAHAVVAGTEQQWCLSSGERQEFSDQHVLNCSSGNCNGGSSFIVMASSGQRYPLCPRAKYDKYRGRKNACDAKLCQASPAESGGWTTAHSIGAKGPLQIVEAISSVGGLIANVSVEGYKSVYRFYGGKKVTKEMCDKAAKRKIQSDHAVFVQGYAHDNATGRTFAYIKNSWGDSWGDKGYMWLELGACGLDGSFVQPVVDAAEVRQRNARKKIEGVVIVDEMEAMDAVAEERM